MCALRVFPMPEQVALRCHIVMRGLQGCMKKSWTGGRPKMRVDGMRWHHSSGKSSEEAYALARWSLDHHSTRHGSVCGRVCRQAGCACSRCRSRCTLSSSRHRTCKVLVRARQRSPITIAGRHSPLWISQWGLFLDLTCWRIPRQDSLPAR